MRCQCAKLTVATEITIEFTCRLPATYKIVQIETREEIVVCSRHKGNYERRQDLFITTPIAYTYPSIR